MLSIGSCSLGGRPRIAVAVNDTVPPESLSMAAGLGADIVELRADLCVRKKPGQILASLRDVACLPRLLTVRSQAEGGNWEGDENERLAVFMHAISEAEAVDIELSAEAIRGPVVARARDLGKISIGSFHDFQGTPTLEVLEGIVQDGQRLGVDIVKIAARCSCRADVNRLARLLLNHEDRSLIVLGMGEAGMATRILFPALGSLLTYTFLGEPSAPGQLNLENTAACMRLLFPNER